MLAIVIEIKSSHLSLSCLNKIIVLYHYSISLGMCSDREHLVTNQVKMLTVLRPYANAKNLYSIFRTSRFNRIFIHSSNLTWNDMNLGVDIYSQIHLFFFLVPKGCFSWRRSVSGGQIVK